MYFQLSIAQFSFSLNIESTRGRWAIVIWHVKEVAYVLFFSKPQPCPACDNGYLQHLGALFSPAVLYVFSFSCALFSSVMSIFTVSTPPNFTHEYVCRVCVPPGDRQASFQQVKSRRGETDGLQFWGTVASLCCFLFDVHISFRRETFCKKRQICVRATVTLLKRTRHFPPFEGSTGDVFITLLHYREGQFTSKSKVHILLAVRMPAFTLIWWN